MLFPQIYNTIDIQVALVGMEIWSDIDKIKVVPRTGVTFTNFLNWHHSNLEKMKAHDHAQLLRWAHASQGKVYVGRVDSYPEGLLAEISVQFYLPKPCQGAWSSPIRNSSVGIWRLMLGH